MERRCVQQLNGRGKVLEGDAFLTEATYSIQIWQEFPGGAPGLKEVVGVVTLEPLQTMDLMARRSELTLEFEDGKRMGFFFTDSNTGAIANTTAIMEPKGVGVS